MTIVAELTIPSVLRERASLQPNDKAFTFLDYDQDWDGVAETITWSQLYRRALNVAQEVRRHGATGDRAVILAPQGLAYIDAFFGTLLAGLIPVPLSVPVGGVVDERVNSVLLDAAPSVVLTTSEVAGDVADYVKAQRDGPAPHLVEVDLVDLDVSEWIPARPRESVRHGVFAVHLRIDSRTGRGGDQLSESDGQFRADDGGLFLRVRKCRSVGHHLCVVAAVLSRHGFTGRGVRAATRWCARRAHQPGGVPGATGAVAAAAGQPYPHIFGRTEFCVRGGGTKDLRRGHGRLRSGQRGRHHQRQRARAARDAQAFFRAVHPVQLSRQGAATLLRNGRSDGIPACSASR